MTFEAPKNQQLPAIGPAPPPPPMFGADPSTAAKKPKQKSMQPSFLGNGTLPTGGQLGTKTLLGS